jgi:RHS repeat-associated protein
MSSEGILPDFRYAGMFLHDKSGFYLTHYRFYDPGAGRWLNRDPIGEAGGTNLYGYVGGNPVNRVDLLGLSAEDVRNIKKIIQREIDRIARNGQRLSSPIFNNVCRAIDGCDPTHDLKDCNEQTDAVKDALNKELKNFDDNWRFDSLNGLGHVWGVAMSSNKDDPIIYFDARANEISIGVPCSACSGWFGGIFDSGETSTPSSTQTQAAPPEIRMP